MSITGLQNARILSGCLASNKVSIGSRSIALQPHRHNLRLLHRSLQTLKAQEEGNVDGSTEVRCCIVFGMLVILNEDGSR